MYAADYASISRALTLLVFLLRAIGDLLLPFLPMLKSKSISSKSTFMRGREAKHQGKDQGSTDKHLIQGQHTNLSTILTLSLSIFIYV